jgi:hypothetical protein
VRSLTLQDGQAALIGQIDRHKDLFWAGLLRRRVDCAESLMVPKIEDVCEAAQACWDWHREATHKDEQIIYANIAERLDEWGKILERDSLGSTEQIYAALYRCIKEENDARDKWYAAMTGIHSSRREAKAYDRAMHAWGLIKQRMLLITVEEVSAEKVYEWRQAACRRFPTAYGAYVMVINHVAEWNTPYRWLDDGAEIRQWAAHYKILYDAEKPGPLQQLHQEQMDTMNYLLGPAENVMVLVHTVVWKYVHIITPILEHVAFDSASGEERQTLWLYQDLLKRILGFAVTR